MIALGDLENIVLSALQQPGQNFVTPGSTGYPNWSQLTSPQYNEGEVDFAINSGYTRACSDLAHLRFSAVTCQLASSAGVGSYPFPPVQPANPYPAFKMILDVFYLPKGAVSPMRFEPGSRLIAWEQFMRKSIQGYDRPLSADLYPGFCAVGPKRNTLEFYPNPLESGDAISVTYAALPTPNAISVATLASQSDEIVLPDDTVDAIVYWALSRLFLKSRSFDAAREFRGLYASEIARIKNEYTRATQGDALIMEDTATISDAPWWAAL